MQSTVKWPGGITKDPRIKKSHKDVQLSIFTFKTDWVKSNVV